MPGKVRIHWTARLIFAWAGNQTSPAKVGAKTDRKDAIPKGQETDDIIAAGVTHGTDKNQTSA